jgi:hypothetical protein
MGAVTIRGITRVDLAISTNSWWDDAFQFGDPADVTWNFVGMSFLSGVKRSENDASPLLSCSSAAGTIVVADPINRVLNYLVTDVAVKAALPDGDYQYDLIMVNNATGQRDVLMYGSLSVETGIT